MYKIEVNQIFRGRIRNSLNSLIFNHNNGLFRYFYFKEKRERKIIKNIFNKIKIARLCINFP